MRTSLLSLILVCICNLSVFAHSVVIDANPTSGDVVFGVKDTSGFTRWRAYIRGLTNNAAGNNSDWTDSKNGWWYKDVSSLSAKATFKTAGLVYQNFEVTYWMFRADNTWDYGAKTIVSYVLPPPPPSAPPTPTNVIATQSYANILLNWSDVVGETSYKLYVNGNFWTTMQQNSTVALHNSGLVSGTRYCYTVTSVNTNGESPQSTSSCVNYVYPIPAPQPDPTPTPPPTPTPTPTPTPDTSLSGLADAYGFEYPVNAAKIYRSENSIPDGVWYDYQPYGSLFNNSSKLHLGHDINYAGSSDYGMPVYAINECVVIGFSDTTVSNAWGKYIVLKCNAPSGLVYRMSDKSTVTSVEVLYAHLSEIKIYTDSGTIIAPSNIVLNSTKVQKGWQIGKIGNANGYYDSASHLHFEIRKTSAPMPGDGYMHFDTLSYLDSHVDALEFIENNKVLQQKTYRQFVHPYDIASNRTVMVELDKTIWSRAGRIGVNERQAVGYGNYLWITDSKSGTQASWSFKLPASGWYEVYLHLPRSYATASNVKYTLWHEGSGVANPYILYVNQNRNPGKNERFLVGKFKFNADWKYSLDIAGTTQEVNPKKIVMDALELVYVYNDGFGGGEVSSQDADGDLIDDAWEISYGYSDSNASDAMLDSDQDGLSTLAEYRLATDPKNPDTDADGYFDNAEYIAYFDPADPNDNPEVSNQGSGVSDEVTDVTSQDDVTEVVELEQEEVDEQDSDATSPVTYNSQQRVEALFSCSASRGPAVPWELLVLFPVLFRRRRLN